MKISKKVQNTALSVTIKIADKVRELEKQEQKIIKFQTGDPHFDTPDNIKEACMKALRENETHYSHSRGLPMLRRLVSEDLEKRFKVKLDPDKNVLITPGAKQAIFYLMMSILNDNDEVIIPTPSWITFGEIVKLSGGKPVFVGCGDEFAVSFERINEVVTDKTKSIILNSPNNPTGRIISKEVLKKVNQLCIEKDIVLLSDECYERIVFEGYKFTSILDINPELKNVVYLNGFSKTYAMTGWRLGYVVADGKLIDAMLKVQQNTVTNPTTFIQFGAMEGLRNGEGFVQNALKDYQTSRDLVVEEFKNLQNFELIPIEGGIYAFIDISKISDDSEEFCLELLDKCKMSACPGVEFGRNGEGYIRICFSTEKEHLVEFVKRLKANYE